MKKYRLFLSATLLASAALSQSAAAVVLAAYNAGPLGTANAASYQASTKDDNVTASSIAASSLGNFTFTSVDLAAFYPSTGNVFQAANITETAARAPGSAPADNSFFSFTVDANDTFQMSIQSIDFLAARGGSSTDRGYDIRSSLDGYLNTISSADIGPQRTFTNGAVSVPLGASFANLTDPVTFRFYVYATSGTSNIEFDNITLNGAIAPVPEASSALLCMGGLGFLALRRRRA